MVARETLVLTWALATSALAAIVPWIQREDEVRVGWERKTLFGILLGDAAYHWLALTAIGSAHPGATWLGSFLVLATGGGAMGAFLVVRGYELPSLVRWGGALALLLVEPTLLTLSFLATR